MKATLVAALLLLPFSAGTASARLHPVLHVVTAKDVEGTVERGPVTPICVAGTPCYRPAPNVTVKAFKAEKLVAETTTNRNGRFTFSLASGYYVIVASGRGTEPRAVHVSASTRVHLRFLIDTGIR